MAATGKTPILLYGSTTATNTPTAGNLTNSSDGCEIAINVADKNLFFKDSTNVVNTVPIRQSSASSNGWLSSTDWSTFNSKAPGTTFTSGYVPYGQGTTTLNQSANLQFNGTVLGVGGAVDTNYSVKAYGAITSTSGANYFAGSLGVGTIPAYKLDVVSGGGSALIFRAGQSGVSNGLTVSSDGANLTYTIDNGNLVIGTAGKGIDFSADPSAAGMTSELLDDYEEGTWTPTVAAISGSYTTVSVAQGSYTKVGRLVTIRFNFTVSDKGTGSGGFVITALPFAANGNSYAGSAFNSSTGVSTVLYGVSMSTQFEGYRYDGTDPVVVNQSQIGVITYFV